MKKETLLTLILISGIFLVAFILRVYGLQHNYPFWADEFSSAMQAQLILQEGSSFLFSPGLEHNHIAGNVFIAFMFSLFGKQQMFARFPFVIIGSLVPVAVFLLTRYLFNLRTAIAASLLVTFSYFEITWSRQARGYILLQLLVVLSLYIYFKIVEKPKKSLWFYTAFLLLMILGIFTHYMLYVFMAALAVHFVLFHRDELFLMVKRPFFYISAATGLSIFFFLGFFQRLTTIFSSQFFNTRNFWYYHSFLWREYGLITMLAILGLALAFLRKPRTISFFVIFIFLQLGVLSYVFKPYVSRYLLPIFPFIFIAAAYTISTFADLLAKEIKRFPAWTPAILSIGMALFIIINGHKFVKKPQIFYSVNHDFREIALVDYNQIYDIVQKKGNFNEGETALIDTSLDRAYWYIENQNKHIYIMRWINDTGLVNGISKSTDYSFNTENERVIANSDKKLIGNLADLQKAMQKYPKGFIYIDDSSMPADVIEYAEKNMKKELYVDHYPLDDNPYSIWPATLYSWGIE